jgi:hypothetical protein
MAQPKPQCCQVTKLMLNPCSTKQGMLEAGLERAAAAVVARSMLHPDALAAVVRHPWLPLLRLCPVHSSLSNVNALLRVFLHWPVKNTCSIA